MVDDRHTLSMEESNNTTFSKSLGVYFSKAQIFFLFLAFIAGIVVTGLLVYNYAPRPGISEKVIHNGSIVINNEEKSKEENLPENTINYRLPKNLVPTHYYLKLLPFINGNFSIVGYVEITFRVRKPTNKIVLHILDIITRNDTVKVYAADNTSRTIKVKSQNYDPKTNFYTATLLEVLDKNENYTIAMDYQAYLNNKIRGFFRSSYIENGTVKWAAVTQFAPISARLAFPCMDEPGLRSEFTVVLGRESNMKSLSNMPLKESKSIENMEGWYWDIYEKSVSMSTYLVAFFISTFDFIESSDIEDYRFKVWARKDVLGDMEYANRIGKPISRFFDNYFNISYPLTKQDMVAIPAFSSAMENWGLIKYRESRLIVNNISTTVKTKQMAGQLIAHEIAHQWFGNLVTPEWWSDIWLNEGFASYMEYVGLHSVEPSFKMMEQILLEELQNVFYRDSLRTSHPLSVDVGSPIEITSIFDEITYMKGASIIRMMSHFLSEETLRKGLTNYLTEFEYKNAVQDDLWSFLTAQAHEDKTLDKNITVKKIMDSWTLQMGYPVVTVTRNSGGETFLIQERFLLSKEKSTEKNYKWWIPITYTTETTQNFENTKPKIWMSPSQTKIKLLEMITSNWYIFNIQQNGYYRVNYDEENWMSLTNQLINNFTIINEINRAQLIDDALDLSRAGLLSYNISLKLTTYLKNEKDYLPWASAKRNLEYIKEQLMHKSGYGSFRNFVLLLLKPLYFKLGFKAYELNKHTEILKSELITEMACEFEYQPCVEEAKSLYNSWMKDPNNLSIIPASHKSTVYCTAIKAGGLNEWEFGWNMYKNMSDTLEKSMIISALGCSRQPWILSGFVDTLYKNDSRVEVNDRLNVIKSIGNNPSGGYIVLEFLQRSLNTLANTVAGSISGLNTILKYGLKYSLKEEEVDHLLHCHKELLTPYQSVIDRIKENVRLNEEWQKNYYEIVVKWLNENDYSDFV